MSSSTVQELWSRVTGKKSDQDLLNYAEDCYKKAARERWNFERQWYTNLAFYFGRQYVQWAATAAGAYTRLYEPMVPNWRVRLVSNKIRPRMRKELSKVMKERPVGFVLPASTSSQDIAGALAGEAIIDDVWQRKNVEDIVRSAQFWNILTGVGFVKDWYDDGLTDPFGVQGDIGIETRTPFHVFVPDLQEKEIENQPFVIDVAAKDVDWVKSRYNKDVSPDASSGVGVLEQKFLLAIGVQAPVAKDQVMVKELWVKPCQKYPDGILIAWAGDQLLFSQEGWPFQHQQYPFTKFTHVETGRFYGESTIVDLIPLQKEYNRTISQIVEAKNRTSKPQLMAYRGSINPRQITSEPGLIILVTPGFTMPVPLQGQSIPQYTFEILDRINRDMDDISSQHEVSRGNVPPGVSAATAISYLQEEDDSSLAATIDSLEDGVEKIGQHVLSHVNQFWTAQRSIRVIGSDNTLEAFLLGKADLQSNTDFRVQSGSADPQSRAAKQAFIMELGNRGWLPPDQVLKYLNMADTNRMYSDLNADSKAAQRENLRILYGGAVNVNINPWDNNAAHIVEHEWELKKEQSEQVAVQYKAELVRHIQLHKMQMSAQQGTNLPPGHPMLPQPQKPGIPIGGPPPQPGGPSSGPPPTPGGPS